MRKFEAPGAVVALLALSLSSAYPALAQGMSEMAGSYGASSALSGTLNKGNTQGAVNNLFNSAAGQMNNAAGGGSSTSGAVTNPVPTTAPAHSVTRAHKKGHTVASKTKDVADPFAFKVGPDGDPEIPDAHVLVKNVQKSSNTLFAQAQAKQKAGDDNGAEKLYMRALGMRNRVWGDKDPAVLKMYLIIGDIESKKKDPKGAEAFYHRALTGALKQYGVGSFELVPYLDKFGDCLYAQQKFDDAVNEYQQVVELRERKLGDDDISTLQGAMKLAKADAAAEKPYWADAEDLLQKKVDLGLKKGGCEPLVVQMLQLQVDVFRKDKKNDKADAAAARLAELKQKSGTAPTSTTSGASKVDKPAATASDKKDSGVATTPSTEPKKQ